MTTGELIVVALFVVGLVCSLTLFVWLVRALRRESGTGQRRVKNNAGQ
ncbi:MAG: hypothetical protein WCY47_01940 [Pusillimonas sp.]